MGLNLIAKRLATLFPWAARPYVWLWGRWTSPTRPHYLFLNLRKELDVRTYRVVALRSGEKMKCDPFDAVGRALFREGVFEPETLTLFERLVPVGGVVLDVGAHVGQYAIRASSLVGPGGRVHAFEPDTRTMAVLKGNIRRNGLKNVALHSCCLSDRPGEATFYSARSDNVGGASLRPNPSSSGYSRSVQVSTLDAVAASEPRIDLVKIDVEGAELLVLRGAQAALELHRPCLIVELSVNSSPFGYTSGELVAWLDAHGYSVFDVGEVPLRPWQESNSRPAWYNVLAVPADRRQDYVARGLIHAS